MQGSDEESGDRDEIRKAFDKVVNTTPKGVEEWLQTEESQSVGWKHDGDAEAVGHEAGRKIVEVKQKKKSELTEADYKHMHKVVGYIHRHMAQGGPADDKEHSRWRFSLMNWGHDPLKK